MSSFLWQRKIDVAICLLLQMILICSFHLLSTLRSPSGGEPETMAERTI
ncbi:MAG: hypothetical protein VKK03_04880 [Synechococcus sp.]|nr:hypothetical protein [Synechococcus sp.]